MIDYILNNKLIRLTDGMPPQPGVITIKVRTFEEYIQQFQDTPQFHIMQRNLTNIRHCKADILGDYVMGTFSVPLKEAPSVGRQSFCFYLTDSLLVFIDDQNTVTGILSQLEEMPLSGTSSPLHFLFDFMEYVIKDDVFFLQHFEEKLTKLEEQLLDGKDEGFDRTILHIRKELAVLGAYYEQLADMGESLQEAPLGRSKPKTSSLFGLFTDRASRLHSDVQMLKEYSMQLREMHQSQIDVRQNQIMKVLTIVTTLFMPLSLIAGWYGMNFINMPELASPYGYAAVIVISLVIIGVELWIFHIKKWFD